jgi:hypothetical protein
VAVVLAAVGLGVYADVGERASGAWGAVPKLGLPWFVLALAAGALARRWRWGAVNGVGAIVLGLVSYVVYKDLAYGSTSVAALLRDDADYWLALALGVGVIGGTGGAWMRSREPFRSIAWGLAGAAACAEGAALLVLVISRDRALGDGARLLVAEVSLGVGVLVWAAREFRPVTVAVSALGWCALGFLGGLVVFDHLV